MARLCSRCHHRIEQSDGEEIHACAKCGAEAGLEEVVATPFAMRLFAVCLTGAVLVAGSAIAFAVV
jgi:hypothetical protein